MTTATIEARPAERVRDSFLTELPDYCEGLFSSLARSDQRRWGEVYVRGLLTVSGRKSIRRICEQIVGWRADQCLQQFVNQSPWNWEPVRRDLAWCVDAAFRAKAWVIAEAVFPKNGSRSVGVEKQYAHPVGRMLNCQLGVTALLAGDGGSCPVNWRLLLPSTWDRDPARRKGAHLPTHVRHRSWSQLLLDMIDQMTADWDLMPAPVVVDARPYPSAETLLTALEERALPYLVRIATPPLVSTRNAPVSMRSPGDLTAWQARRNGTILNWRDGADGRLTRSQFVLGPASGPVDWQHDGPQRADMSRPGRQVLMEWKPGRSTPKAVWLTNIHTDRLSHLVELIALRTGAEQDLARLNDGCGLQHFEGRSYRGWHHHVTLVSAAHGFRLLAGRAERMPRYA